MTAVCKDGSRIRGWGNPGTCSTHGGVVRWEADPVDADSVNGFPLQLLSPRHPSARLLDVVTVNYKNAEKLDFLEIHGSHRVREAILGLKIYGVPVPGEAGADKRPSDLLVVSSQFCKRNSSRECSGIFTVSYHMNTGGSAVGENEGRVSLNIDGLSHEFVSPVGAVFHAQWICAAEIFRLMRNAASSKK